MKAELKENGGLPAHILWTLAIVAGISVANLYYNQPLLNVIRHELGVSEFKTNLIAPTEKDHPDKLHFTDIFTHSHSHSTQYLYHLGSFTHYRYLLHDPANLRTDSLAILLPGE